MKVTLAIMHAGIGHNRYPMSNNSLDQKDIVHTLSSCKILYQTIGLDTHIDHI